MVSLFCEHQGVQEFLVLHGGNIVPIEIQTNRKKSFICDVNKNDFIHDTAIVVTMFLFCNILTTQIQLIFNQLMIKYGF